MDWLRTAWPFGGFSWGSLGVSQVDNRAALRLATVTGVWGVTFVVVAVNALLVEAAVAGGGGAGVGPVRWRRRSSWRRRDRVLRPRRSRASTSRRSRWTCAGAGTPPPRRTWPSRGMNIALHRRLGGTRRTSSSGARARSIPAAATDPEMFAEVEAAIADVGVADARGRVLERPRRTQEPGDPASTATGGSSTGTRRRTSCRSGSTSPCAARWRGSARSEQIPGRPHAGGARAHHRIGACRRSARRSASRTASRRSTATSSDGAGFLVVLTNNASYGRPRRPPAPADEPDAGGRERAVGRARGGLRDQRVHRSERTRRGGGGLFRPAILRHTIRSSDAHVVRPAGGLGPLALPPVVVACPRSLAARRRPGARRRCPDRPRTLVVLPTYDERDTIEGCSTAARAARAGGRPRRGRLLARRDRTTRAGASRRTTEGPAARAPREVRSGERVPGGVPRRRRGGLRPRRGDGLRSVAPARGALRPPGAAARPRPHDRQPVHPGRVGDNWSRPAWRCRGRGTGTRA